MKPLRIAHIAPVATTIPPPKSGSVETMTSLLTEGLVAAATTSRCSRPAIRRPTAKLHAIYPHGYWHDENMWPWELYEMLNLAAAVERARDFDIIHYEAAYYPMSLAFTRLSPTPILQTLHHSPSAAGNSALVAVSRGAVRRHFRTSRRASSRPERRRHGAARHRHRQLHVPRAPGRLPAVSRPLHRRQGRAAGDRDRQARRHAARARRRGRRVLSRTRGAARRRHADRLCRRSGLRRPRSSCTAARARCSTRFRRASRSASCSPRPWRAARRSPRSIAAPCAKSSTTASRASSSGPRADGQRAAARAVARSPARPRAGRRALRRRAHGGRVRGRLPTACGVASCPPLMRRACRPDDPRRLRASRRRVAGVRRHAGAAADAGARVVLLCASRGEAGSTSDPALVPDGDLGSRARARAARRGRGAGHRRVDRDRSSGRRSALGATCPSCTRDRDDHRAIQPGRRSSPSPKTGCTGTSITSASTSGRTPRSVARADGAAALLRDDAAGRHARGRRSRARQGRSAARFQRSGALRRTRSARGAKPPTFVVDVREWIRRKLAAHRCHRTQMGPHNPLAWLDDDDARRWLGLETLPSLAARVP